MDTRSIPDVEISLSLRYLYEAAHVFATTAPMTSRHLMATCNAVMLGNNIKQPEAHKGKICNACGTIRNVNEWSTTLLKGGHPQLVKGKRVGPAEEKLMVYTCGACNRRTRQNIVFQKVKPNGRRLQEPNGVDLQASRSTAMPELGVYKTPNESSKRRAKARKKSGLEAMLASKKAKESQSSGIDLDLFDMMKKG